ncbi:hypothetical protein SprV_0401715900 [Sparganum proliferum]
MKTKDHLPPVDTSGVIYCAKCLDCLANYCGIIDKRSILKQTGESDETKKFIRQQVTSLVIAHKPRATITKAEQSALKTLRADTSIVILPADKGRSTVVMDKADYIQKANALLEDRQAYLPCKDEPMRRLVTQLDKTLADMQTSKAISKSVRLAIKPVDAAAPRFYGLPKVHKAGVPLRPIVSLRGAPTFNLARWLFRNLRSLTSDAGTTVCSATQFLERTKEMRLTDDEVLVSFDVTSHFTSIPQDLAVETVSELLESQYDETGVTVRRRYLVQLLKFCLTTYFTFEGTTYEQVKWTPMGSPLLGFIAEAVLQKVETLVFATYKPKFWTRYVDDTFVIIKRQMVQEFHDVLNSVFPDTQFTREAEANNQLPFLDVLVRRKPNGYLKTTCNSSEVNYIGETGKRLQTRVGEHMRAVRRMDPLSLVAEHCADSGQTFAFQNAELLGRGNDRIARETIEGWHTGTTSINRCVALPDAYQALRAQLSKQMTRLEPKLNMNPDMSESMADAHSVTPQPGADEGAVVATAVPSNSPADEKTDSRCGVNKIASLGRQLRSRKVRTTATNVSTPARDVD